MISCMFLISIFAREPFLISPSRSAEYQQVSSSCGCFNLGERADLVYSQYQEATADPEDAEYEDEQAAEEEEQ